jgi:HEAT repeat protein
MIKISRSRKRKAEALEYLGSRDRDGIITWTRENESALRTLFTLTFHHDETIRWRAIESIGIAVKEVGRVNIEKVREFIRSMIWLMCDESGGIGWHAPQAIAETLYGVPSLLGEYGKLLPKYLIEEPFIKSAHFALVRISEMDREIIEDAADILVGSLNDSDPAIRGCSIIALGVLKSNDYAEHIKKFARDKSKFKLYDFSSGTIIETTVGQIAESAM